MEHGGLVIRAYSNPLYFMSTAATGSGRPMPWLERVKRNAPGTWYKLTPAGLDAVRSIKEEPPVPPRNPYSDFGRKGC